MNPMRLLLVALAIGLPACASTTAAGGDQPQRDLNRISAVEVRETHYRNAYDIVQALRPAWITSRGQISLLDASAGQVVVYLDGVRAGGADYLRQIPLSSVDFIEYLNGASASARYGLNHAGGAILVSTRLR